MPEAIESWTESFRDVVENNNVEDAIRILAQFRTGHAGTPPQAIKARAIGIIEKLTVGDLERRLAVAYGFVRSEDDGAKEIGISLLSACYGLAPAEVAGWMRRIGDDPNWEVREWAGTALGRTIPAQFADVLPRLRVWAADDSANVRRLVVVAIGYATKACSPDETLQLLTLLTPLMADRDPYVGKNLGAYAIGSYAIRHHPVVVASWTATLDLAEEQTAWNLAMTFTTGGAPG
ncbi:MAG TPA: HEAT repeat domain-containing protein, partial [Thermomicrobiales bacterium]|nr:HEAT repeat domain-containing protein [Thermomicrobiales bacterium]